MLKRFVAFRSLTVLFRANALFPARLEMENALLFTWPYVGISDK
jgi:hypothetical protein